MFFPPRFEHGSTTRSEPDEAAFLRGFCRLWVHDAERKRGSDNERHRFWRFCFGRFMLRVMCNDMAHGLGSNPANTKGRRALVRALKERSQTELSRQIGVSQPTISYWASGERRPDPIWRRQLSKHLGIPETDWMTREEFVGERASN